MHVLNCSDCKGRTDSAADPHNVPRDRPLCTYHRTRVQRFARMNPERKATS